MQHSGYYAWLRGPASMRERDDQRLLGLIKHHWLASGGVYDYRKITVDLREAGEFCSRLACIGLSRPKAGARRSAIAVSRATVAARSAWWRRS